MCSGGTLFQVLLCQVLLVSICIQVFKDIVPSCILSNQVPISTKHHQRKEMITTTSYVLATQEFTAIWLLTKNGMVSHTIWLLRRISWNVGDTPVPPSLPLQSVLTLLPLGPSAGLWGIHVSYRLQLAAMSVMHVMLKWYFLFCSLIRIRDMKSRNHKF